MNMQLVESLIQVINSLSIEERALPEEKLLVTPAPPLLPQPYPTASA